MIRTLLGAGLALAGGFAGGMIVGKRWGIPGVSRDSEYSISIYTGSSIDALQPHPLARTPAISPTDVTDIPARFVADPFILKNDGAWWMFFEAVDRRTERGAIGVARSDDGLDWTYDRIVLSEPFHISYPFVFKDGDEIYMVPESMEAYRVGLYRAVSFPYTWELVQPLLHGPYVDSTPFQHDGKWWMFSATGWGNLHLFHSDRVLGKWTEHPSSPLLVGDDSHARPGGRVVVTDSGLIRLAQDDAPYYGRQLRAFEILKLSTSEYQERELASSPLLSPSGQGWNRDGMHHMDAHELDDGQWLAAVDGFRLVVLLNRRRVRFGV